MPHRSSASGRRASHTRVRASRAWRSTSSEESTGAALGHRASRGPVSRRRYPVSRARPPCAPWGRRRAAATRPARPPPREAVAQVAATTCPAVTRTSPVASVSTAQASCSVALGSPARARPASRHSRLNDVGLCRDAQSLLGRHRPQGLHDATASRGDLQDLEVRVACRASADPLADAADITEGQVAIARGDAQVARRAGRRMRSVPAAALAGCIGAGGERRKDEQNKRRSHGSSLADRLAGRRDRSYDPTAEAERLCNNSDRQSIPLTSGSTRQRGPDSRPRRLPGDRHALKLLDCSPARWLHIRRALRTTDSLRGSTAQKLETSSPLALT